MASNKFHFTNTRPSEQAFSDIQSLNSLGEPQLRAFTTILLKFLGENSDLMGSIGEFANSIGANVNALTNLVRGVLYFLKGATKSTLPPDLLKADLVAFGVNEARADLIAELYEEHLPSLRRTEVANTLMVNELVDMDWKFGVTASNSELGRVGSTFLQLKLVLDKGNTKTETVHMELTLPQFYEFLSQMETVKQQLDVAT
eukprot:TRINITY_DN4979_c0_g1_i1.p1 TRINITY_DN4979_c0_g1~~TRINITY_DN4979_c0_g1_i1.p1  ORF type:complete len:201 (-),score=37.56 TRINITY_DN4979_c0_g1_i1:151-753(-)